MKKALLACLLLVACASQKDRKSDKEIFVYEFKIHYFKKCLKYGFGDSPEIQRILALDKSGYSEPVLGMLYIEIDSLAKKRAMYYKLLDINSTKEHTGASKKERVLSNCLCDYNSKWLDSIIKKKYKGN
ncbi:MAG: hypothetical protein EOO50_09290 [Flavobacterium sp.]|uniref:hypothetical protein n=1 Tax=Flavobacterium sp. TaxID=239 RepID=UPI00120781FE|nr:hypothetical protein [Flavobacterium sp.]RZJ66556.1 MAG: hypothetical protein EOO50_09290 [Flavobacterium sp.]